MLDGLCARLIHRPIPWAASILLASLLWPGLGDAKASLPPTPQQLYGPLFAAVQTSSIFADSKTFPDALPKQDPGLILAQYQSAPPAGADAIRTFVAAHFTLPDSASSTPPIPAASTLRQHIAALWPLLGRPPLQPPRWSSALALPATYVVPGGRFREIYYWDSYFTMLGLRADGRSDLVESMFSDFESLLDRYGFIPNGTRSYYLSRSQPPLFAAMSQQIATQDTAGENAIIEHLQIEDRYWMNGTRCLARRGPSACEHVVRLADGAILNRYWDASASPRDEAYAQDLATAAASGRPAGEVYRDLRAAAESGWDFSSRWLVNPQQLASIHTTDIVPVDLNSLLYQLETEIARRCQHLGKRHCQDQYQQQAQARSAAINRYLWDAGGGRYADYDTRLQRATPSLSAATLYPLWVGLASQLQADAVANTVRLQLLARGGVRTTAITSGQQWDAPNGWAPLQWIAIDGLARYGQHSLAHDLARRWINTVNRSWQQTGKLLEKYDIEQQTIGGGGEYPTQDGFGWTNGVTAALLQRYPDLTP